MISRPTSSADGIAAQPEPLECDVDIARAALEVAINRSLAETAAQAAATLWRRHPVVLRRLLARLAFEAVGIGDVDAVVEATSAASRTGAGVNLADGGSALIRSVRKLAEAPKEPGTMSAVTCTLFHPDLESMKASCARASVEERANLAVDPECPTAGRAVAAMSLASLDEPRGRAGGDGLDRLFAAYRRVGVPGPFLEAARSAFRLCRTPAAVVAPTIWLRTRSLKKPIEIEDVATPMVAAIPLAAVNGETRLGRIALRRFRAENDEIAAKLVAGFRPSVAARALRLAVSIDETQRVTKRLHWPGVEHLERDSVDAAFIGIGADPEEGDELGALVLKRLDQLNAIRTELLAAQLSRRRGA